MGIPSQCGEEFDVNSTASTCEEAKQKGTLNANKACKSWFPKECPGAVQASEWKIIAQNEECTVTAKFVCMVV